MNITLSKLKVYDKLSEETMCFGADIMLDGKKVGEVSNRGQGGCHEIWWADNAIGKQITEYAKKIDTSGFTFEHLDRMLTNIALDMQEEKEYKRWAKKGTYFRLKGDEKDKWRTVNGNGKKLLYSPRVKEWIMKTYGDKVEEILNERFA